MNRTFSFAAGIGSVIALLFIILACALPQWVVVNDSDNGATETREIGIWQNCYRLQDASHCSALEGAFSTSAVRVTRAFVVIDIILAATATGLIALSILADQEKAYIIVAMASAFAALCGAIATGSYANDSVIKDFLQNEDRGFGPSFYLCIVSLLLQAAATVLILYAWWNPVETTDEEEQPLSGSGFSSPIRGEGMSAAATAATPSAAEADEETAAP